MLKRVLAFAMAIVLFVLVVAAFILGISGSEYFMAMLYIAILVSVIFYAMVLMARVLGKKGQELAEDAAKENDVEM